METTDPRTTVENAIREAMQAYLGEWCRACEPAKLPGVILEFLLRPRYRDALVQLVVDEHNRAKAAAHR
ncbi:MAG: hypothetical protein ACRD9L_15170 [Bryobacteraceae bacterium]